MSGKCKEYFNLLMMKFCHKMKFLKVFLQFVSLPINVCRGRPWYLESISSYIFVNGKLEYTSRKHLVRTLRFINRRNITNTAVKP
jgi:hypothetical protein